MVKKHLFGLSIILFFVCNLYSGEWDYVPNIQLRYISNDTEEEFYEINRTFDPNSNRYGYRWIKTSKLPKEVNQAIWGELKSYDLDVGDIFIFSCGYEYGGMTPKAIVIFLQIDRGKSGWTYNYYAWQLL